jgi:hypothetical protein
MLADFQQALADLTASPAFCRAVREDARALSGRYSLTDRERARLIAIVNHAGMAAACTVYRMNRIAPLAMNLPATLRALGPRCRDWVEAYWQDHPRGHAHFFVESDRFCRWAAARIDPADTALSQTLAREGSVIRHAIDESRPLPA